MSDPVQCHANADSAVAIRSPIRFPLPRRASLASVRRTSPHPRHATQLRAHSSTSVQCAAQFMQLQNC